MPLEMMTVEELQHLEEWALQWIGGIATGVVRGKSTIAQLNGARRRLSSWKIDEAKVEAMIAARMSRIA